MTLSPAKWTLPTRKSYEPTFWRMKLDELIDQDKHKDAILKHKTFLHAIEQSVNSCPWKDLLYCIVYNTPASATENDLARMRNIISTFLSLPKKSWNSQLLSNVQSSPLFAEIFDRHMLQLADPVLHTTDLLPEIEFLVSIYKKGNAEYWQHEAQNNPWGISLVWDRGEGYAE